MLLQCKEAIEGAGMGFRFFVDYRGLIVCGWDRRIDFSADTEAAARAKMLVYLLEHKLIPEE